MSETLTLEQVPAELKTFWDDEAKRNPRSLRDEIIHALEEERLRREVLPHGAKNFDEVQDAVRRLHSIPVRDDASINELL